MVAIGFLPFVVAVCGHLLHSGDAKEEQMAESPVRELRLAVTVENYEEALRFYRDALGLPVVDEWDHPDGSGAVLDAGRATLELLSVGQSDVVDRVEVGELVSGPIRLALEVEDSEQTAKALSPEARIACRRPGRDAVVPSECARARARRHAADALHRARLGRLILACSCR